MLHLLDKIKKGNKVFFFGTFNIFDKMRFSNRMALQTP
jgi:hypothetical protein